MKAVVSRAVGLQECSLREFLMYLKQLQKIKTQSIKACLGIATA